MRTLTITEAREQRLALSDPEAAALQDVGRRLIGTHTWWGSDDAPRAIDRSVIRAARTADGTWLVRAGNVVGVVIIGDLQIVVQPKIPNDHLLYLLHVSGNVPRFDSSAAGGLAGDRSLFELLAFWFMGCLEDVLRADLLRDYRATNDFLPALRGKLRTADTARAFYRGSVGLSCDYEHYDVDSPLNRLLKSAARALLSNPMLDSAVQRRAARAAARMSEVNDFTAADRQRVVVDRRTRHCSDAVALARQILSGTGLTLQAGSGSAWTFLIETSGPVEAGLREMIRCHLPGADVRKRGIRLGGATKMTLNPDVVFGTPAAVADIKYKVAGREWDRGDLYQLVAFATGFRVQRAALLGFGLPPGGGPSPVWIGDVEITPISWDTSSSSPVQAGEDFVRRVAQWLSAAGPTEPD
jgi:5-methylcytosine-specific restriction enzyme subunit McrC